MKSKKIIIVLIVSLLIFGCKQELKEVKLYYPNGQLKAIYYEDSDTLLQGASTSFYENGNVHTESFWKNGHQYGKSMLYDESGSLLEMFSYKHDQLDGLSKEFYPTKSLKAQYVYKNGLQESYKIYNEQGALIQQFSKAMFGDTLTIHKNSFYNDAGLYLESWSRASDSSAYYKFQLLDGGIAIDEERVVLSKRTPTGIVLTHVGPMDVLDKIEVVEIQGYTNPDWLALTTKTMTPEGGKYRLKEYNEFGVEKKSTLYDYSKYTFGRTNTLKIDGANTGVRIFQILFYTNRKGIGSYVFEKLLLVKPLK